MCLASLLMNVRFVKEAEKGIYCTFGAEKQESAFCVVLLTAWSVAVAQSRGVVDSLCSLAAVQARPGSQMW